MKEESGDVLIYDVPSRAETVVIDVSLGADGAYANMAEPRPSDAVRGDASAPGSLRSPCLDLVVSSPGPSLLGSTAPGDAILAPGSLGAIDSGVTKLGLLGYPYVLSPAVN
jgi:hypothetical protein